MSAKRTVTGLALGVAVFAMQAMPAHAATSVGLELNLLIDTSGSISSSDFNLQKQGYANAFNNSAIQSAIAGLPTGSLATNVVFWSGQTQQSVAIPWTQVTGDASGSNSAGAFASQISGLSRAFSGVTAQQSALAFSVNNSAADHRRNDFDSPRQVIDLSSDGLQNSGPRSGSAGRDVALAAGIDTINALLVGTTNPNSGGARYLRDEVVGGDGKLFLTADFTTFGNAIAQKLQADITGGGDGNGGVRPIPVPAALPLFATALAGMGVFGWRRKRIA